MEAARKIFIIGGAVARGWYYFFHQPQEMKDYLKIISIYLQIAGLIKILF